MKKRMFINKSAYCCLLTFAALFTMRATSVVDGSEFSGGRVTGPILLMAESAIVMLVVAAVVAFLRLRIAAVMALVASFLALPYLVYMLAPGPFRSIFPGNYSVFLQANFMWQPESAKACVILLVAMLYSGWMLLSKGVLRRATAADV